jgi:hypothetical protein
MGRGRAKAKQAKVARQLKYSGAGTDLDALRKELLNGAPAPSDSAGLDDEFDDLDDDGLDDDDEDTDDEFGGYGANSR